jgi:flagellar secretion chaperone FliS
MYGNTATKNPYVQSSVETASPARLLVMLYDRLVLDVQRGLEAQRTGNLQEAHNQLVHAQEIVIHLRSTLRVELWDGGPGLASLYDWLHNELIKANIRKDPQLTEGCLGIITDLADAWKQAAVQVATAQAAS